MNFAVFRLTRIHSRGHCISFEVVSAKKHFPTFELKRNTMTSSQVYWSCSLTWRNELFVFGGIPNRRQISKLVKYSLKVIGSLSFDHKYGSCTNLANKKLFLCFNSDFNSQSDYKKCRWTDEPLGVFEDAALTTYNHNRGSRVSSSEGKTCF